MRKDLIYVSTKGMSEYDWLQYRFNGIGASEVGCVLGLSPYKSSIELFYEKLGEVKMNVENMAMFFGKEMEQKLAEWWECWDGTEEGMITNYRNKTPLRRCRKINAYVVNPAYPWLFASLDRVINKHEDKGEGSLELKTLGGWEADKWEAGIPPSHIVQVQQQCLVTDTLYGELCVLQDGRKFMVYPFERMDAVCETIVERTKEFWDKVVEARRLVTVQHEAMKKYNQRLVDDCTEKIHQLEPEPDGSDAYTRFLKEHFKIAVPGEIAGTLEDLDNACKDLEYQGRIKELEEQRRHVQNLLKNQLREKTVLDFGPNGHVSWKPNVNGVRVFNNKVKYKP